MFFKSRIQAWVIVMMVIITAFLRAVVIINIVEGQFNFFMGITLVFFALSLANFLYEIFRGGYTFEENRLVIRQGIVRQNISYSDIRVINLSENFVSDIELDLGKKAPITINVKNKEGFLLELKSRISQTIEGDDSNEI